MANGEWPAWLALAAMVIFGLAGYIRKPSYVSAARIEEMEDTIKDLRRENDRLKIRSDQLEGQNAALRDELQWYQKKYREQNP